MNGDYVKYAGAALLFICSNYVGVTCAIGYSRDIAALEDLIKLIGTVRREIEYGSVPLCDILAAYKPDTPLLSDYLKHPDALTADAFYSRLSGCGDAVRSFFTEAGKLYKSEVLRRCDSLCTLLETRSSELKKDCANRQKLSRSLGFLIGVCVVIAVI